MLLRPFTCCGRSAARGAGLVARAGRPRPAGSRDGAGSAMGRDQRRWRAPRERGAVAPKSRLSQLRVGVAEARSGWGRGRAANENNGAGAGLAVLSSPAARLAFRGFAPGRVQACPSDTAFAQFHTTSSLHPALLRVPPLPTPRPITRPQHTTIAAAAAPRHSPAVWQHLTPRPCFEPRASSSHLCTAIPLLPPGEGAAPAPRHGRPAQTPAALRGGGGASRPPPVTRRCHRQHHTAP